MMSPSDVTTSGLSRVWITENGAGPFNAPAYQGCMKIGDATWSLGDITKVECPDPNRYGSFIEAASIPGQVERPTFSIMGRYPMELSEMLRLSRKRCPLDVQRHMGKCRTPQDFNEGWEKVVVYPGARLTSWADENAGAINSEENDVTNETVEVSSTEIYEIVRLAYEELAPVTVVREIMTIDVCDSVDCGVCGEASDGCSKYLATMVGIGVTPGTQPTVLYTPDAGDTWFTTIIDTLFANEPPSDAQCIGGKFVIVSNIPNSLHYAQVADIMGGTEVWVEVNSGFVAGGGPNAIWSADARHTWIVGDGGYIYFAADVATGVAVQNAGIVTVQNYVDVHAYDNRHVVAVGNLNAVAYTQNGGGTWQAVTGPVPGIGLNCVWMHGPETWIVGDASGRAWKTRNAGVSWTLYTNIPVALVRIDEIEFTNGTVGYMAARDGAAHGIILRTIDGGLSWYVLPEGPGGVAIPDNDRINSIAVCAENPNVVLGGGLGGNGTDGIIVKAA
jgi:photosystem II stability/assembly factor-like uncharacterized protein